MFMVPIPSSGYLSISIDSFTHPSKFLRAWKVKIMIFQKGNRFFQRSIFRSYKVGSKSPGINGVAWGPYKLGEICEITPVTHI